MQVGRSGVVGAQVGSGSRPSGMSVLQNLRQRATDVLFFPPFWKIEKKMKRENRWGKGMMWHWQHQQVSKVLALVQNKTLWQKKYWIISSRKENHTRDTLVILCFFWVLFFFLIGPKDEIVADFKSISENPNSSILFRSVLTKLCRFSKVSYFFFLNPFLMNNEQFLNEQLNRQQGSGQLNQSFCHNQMNEGWPDIEVTFFMVSNENKFFCKSSIFLFVCLFFINKKKLWSSFSS